MTNTRIQWIGLRSGRLVVEAFSHKNGHKKVWLCRCDCGNTSKVQDSNLRSGHTTSCGCAHDEARKKTHLTHGMSETSMHDIWVNMRQRCNNPNNPAFDRYGGRGIKVCKRWEDSFENFAADMGERPSPTHSIDRKNNNKGYSPGNCRWATASEQTKNRRPYTLKKAAFLFCGKETTVYTLSKTSGISPATLYKRRANGWPDDLLLSPPDKRFSSSDDA